MSNTLSRRTQSQRAITLTSYILFATVTLRAVLSYGGTPGIGLGLALLAIFLLLFTTEPRISQRWAAYRWIYLCLETGLVLYLGVMAPEFDFLWSLYIILAIYAFMHFPRRIASIEIGVLIVIAAPFLIAAMGAALGLAILLNLIAVGYFMVSFIGASWQAEVARNESAALLNDLQQAHAQLQDYADRAEELSTVRERNRVARELHDSVNQTIFSITLTTEAARTMLDRDPARVPPYLNQLQGMTSNALAQLRSLIGQLRPRSDGPTTKPSDESGG
jgi:signal transduction histidine kinase